jgi:hypothetical protein
VSELKKGLLLILVVALLLVAGTGCVKRVETMDHDKLVKIPEKAVPAKDAAVAAEVKVMEAEEAIEDNQQELEDAQKALEEAKKNEADPDEYSLIKESQGKLW